MLQPHYTRPACPVATRCLPPHTPQVPLSSRILQRGAAAPMAVRTVPSPVVNTKQHPQMSHLPRFEPPRFQAEDGGLPCPESPDSTPRGGRADSPQKGPFAIGSVVEYRSRSSNQWLVAKVEGFDPAAETYALDIQSEAAADRVRSRDDPAETPQRGNVRSAGTPQKNPWVLWPTEFASPHTEHKQLPPPREETLSQDSRADLLAQVESMRREIQKLTSEKQRLQDQVLEDAKLKEQLSQELCPNCRLQMSRCQARASR